MPRLPTMRVIGSQDMSTRLPVSAWRSLSSIVTVAMCQLSFLVPRRGTIAGGQFGAFATPFRFLVGGVLGEPAEGTNHAAVEADRRRRQPCAGRLVHEWHELVGEPRHCAADA